MNYLGLFKSHAGLCRVATLGRVVSAWPTCQFRVGHIKAEIMNISGFTG